MEREEQQCERCHGTGKVEMQISPDNVIVQLCQCKAWEEDHYDPDNNLSKLQQHGTEK